MALDNDHRFIGTDEAELPAQTDALCGFLLKALMDDDGRVRLAAKRRLKDVFRTYDVLNDEETLEALVGEAKEEAKSSLQPGIARLVEGFQEAFGHSPQEDL
jgi:hypothetical protein